MSTTLCDPLETVKSPPDAGCVLCGHSATLGQAKVVCKVPSNVRMFQHEKFTVWRCENCRSLHSHENVDLDRYYKHYPFKQHEMNFATRCAYNNRLRLLRKRDVCSSDKVLDYGCGEGLFVDFLHEKGFQNVAGYDAFAEEYSNEAVLEDQFDVIVSYDVIEHVEEPRSFFDSLVNLLAPGGLLVVGTPNAEQIDLSRWEEFSMELHQPYHRHILSEQVLMQLGRDAGLKAEYVYHRFYFDTLYPSVNTRFMEEYVRATGSVIDVVVEEPQPGVVFRSPRLLFHAFFGYFAPPRGNMMAFFRK